MESELIAIAEQAFSRIVAGSPELTVERHPNDQVEISIELPVQPGLKHKVWLALQNNDELHFSVGHFWLEWFPCTKAAKVDAYVEAVRGFLSGRYRVLEHERKGKCLKAELQAPTLQGWETVGTWSKLRAPSFAEVQFNIIRALLTYLGRL